MVSSGTASLLRRTVRLSLFLIMGLALLPPLSVQAQESSPPSDPGALPTVDTPEREGISDPDSLQPLNPNELRPLSLDSSFLSVEGGKRLIEEADAAIASENYTEAEKKFQEARQVFNQLSNFYQQLATSFSGVDNRIADSHRNVARETAQMRDTATYQLALLHQTKNQPELAVPLLVQIIRSQAPTRDLGKQAYEQLLALSLDSSFLSVEGGKRLIEEADAAIASENYTEAEKKFQEARQVFNQLSNFHQQLATSFSGVDNAIADSHRNLARETAQMRDTSTYQLALLHRAKNQPELAVPLLVQIIRSQAPTRDLGKKAYQQLLELGFVTAPFPRVGGGAPQPTSAVQ